MEQIDLLITQFGSGDPDAFTALIAPLKSDLWGFLINHTKSVSDAEDLFQEICLKIAKKINTLKNRSRFRSWVFSIAINSVRSFYRGPKPVLQTIDNSQNGNFPAMELKSCQADPEKQLAHREKLAFLKSCMAELPKKDRELLLLDAMGDLPQKDIATMMDLNLNTVKTLIRRARIKLARRMAEVCGG